MSEYLTVLALLCVAGGLFTVADAIKYAGRSVGEALWHPDYMDPPKWWKR